MPYSDPERQRKYQLQWMLNRRLGWIAEHGPCIDCGTWEHLEVDHVSARLKVSHRVWSWREEKRRKELAKCVVRCHSCHVLKTLLQHEHPEGEGSANAKLSEPEVLAIRASEEPYRVLALRYGVDHTLIYQIKKRKAWKHI